MKRIYTYILVACATLFVGCQKDFGNIWTAEIEDYQSGRDKVVLDYDNYSCWEHEDAVSIAVADQTVGRECKISISNEQASILNAPEVGADGNVRAFYPFSEDICFNNGNISYKLPQVQEFKSVSSNEPSKQRINAPMMAVGEVAEDNTCRLGFKNVNALLQIIVPYSTFVSSLDDATDVPVSIKGIQILAERNDDGSPVALWGDVSYSNSDFTCSVTNNDATKHFLTLSIPNNENYGTIFSSDSPHQFIISIPPVEESKFAVGITYEKNGVNYAYESPLSGANTIRRNTITTIDLSEIEGTTGPGRNSRGTGTMADPYLISSYNDIKTIANGYNEEYIYCKQVADIVLPVTFNGFFPNNIFNGQYDGDGYLISTPIPNPRRGNSIITYGGLFSRVNKADIKNVILDVNAQTTQSGSVGMIISNIDATGGSPNITLTDCSVTGSIKIENDASDISSAPVIGTMIGDFPSGGTVKVERCVAEVNVVEDADPSFCMGMGMIGRVLSIPVSIEMTNCRSIVTATFKTTIDDRGEFSKHTTYGGMIGQVSLNHRESSVSVSSGYDVYIKLNKCISEGSITNGRRCGGLIGGLMYVEDRLGSGFTSYVYILNSVNACDFIAPQTSGGMCGEYAFPNAPLNVRNSYTKGSLGGEFLKLFNGDVIGVGGSSSVEVSVSNYYVEGVNSAKRLKGGHPAYPATLTIESVYVPSNYSCIGNETKYNRNTGSVKHVCDMLNANRPTDGAPWLRRSLSVYLSSEQDVPY